MDNVRQIQTHRNMKIIRGKDIEFIPVSHEDPKDPGAFKKILLKKEELSPGRIQIINWAKLLVGRTMAAHAHENMEEIFIILHGSAMFRVGHREVLLKRGDAVKVSAREVHEMKTHGKKEVLYIVIGIV